MYLLRCKTEGFGFQGARLAFLIRPIQPGRGDTGLHLLANKANPHGDASRPDLHEGPRGRHFILPPLPDCHHVPNTEKEQGASP